MVAHWPGLPSAATTRRGRCTTQEIGWSAAMRFTSGRWQHRQSDRLQRLRLQRLLSLAAVRRQAPVLRPVHVDTAAAEVVPALPQLLQLLSLQPKLLQQTTQLPQRHPQLPQWNLDVVCGCPSCTTQTRLWTLPGARTSSQTYCLVQQRLISGTQVHRIGSGGTNRPL